MEISPQNLENEEYERLLKRISTLHEPQLHNLVMRVFNGKGKIAEYTHGASEHGADITLEVKPSEDPLRRSQYILFQVKEGNISMDIWQNHLYAQLTELYCKPLDLITVSNDIPRRIVLITSGEITIPVKTEIGHWNAKLPIPIEVFDGKRLAQFLSNEKYTAKQISELIKPRVRPVGKAPKPRVRPLGAFLEGKKIRRVYNDRIIDDSRS